jgi:hypothetical protein
MLILLIHEHGRAFYLLISSLTSLFSGLWFSLKRSLVSFVKFILSCFIIFEANASGIVSVISFSAHSFLAYGKAIDFCMLILYPAILQKEFVVSNSFLVEFLESLSYRLILPAN